MIHLFDLDLTLWDCYNKRGDPIWAKQMVFSFKRKDNIITDDVDSICKVRDGVREYLEFLSEGDNKIGFVSAGKHPTIPYEYQQSIHLLRKFDIYKYFNNIKILENKLYDKTLNVKSEKNSIIFYDDNDEVINKMRHFKHVTVIDTKKINWNELVGKEYD